MTSLAPYVRILGRGPGRARSLTQDEAREAMEIILSGEADPEALGALLMLMRYRGESAGEIAGFVQALRAEIGPWDRIRATLDWPSYAAGRTRGAPLFLLSAKIVAQAGGKVLLHGANSHQSAAASVRDGLDSLGIPTVKTPAAAREALAKDNIAYVPLEALSTKATKLLRLRDKLGLRSCINTVLRMLNPAGAPAAVQGVFHPSYRDLQADAGALLGRQSITVIKGGGGEFERHPGKSITAYGLFDGVRSEELAPQLILTSRRLHEPDDPLPAPADLWAGRVTSPFAEAVVTGTAALALRTAGLAPTVADGQAQAMQHWARRLTDQAA